MVPGYIFIYTEFETLPSTNLKFSDWLSMFENQTMVTAQLTRSMSKKGCSPDNSACEGFFGRLKNEMFYCYSWAGVTINQFIEELDKYIRWYAEKRIKLSLGEMSPLDYRRSLGLVVLGPIKRPHPRW